MKTASVDAKVLGIYLAVLGNHIKPGKTEFNICVIMMVEREDTMFYFAFLFLVLATFGGRLLSDDFISPSPFLCQK